jgi:aspartyl-tRNA(Asn)/glutamyl-tRNA(Gln) amidotransferase subunit C
MAAIDRERVAHIAKLARLELTEAELQRMASELQRIVAYVEQLEQVDIEGVPPATWAVERLPLRDDEPVPSLPHDVALSQAPRAIDGGFAVPTFVEES